MAKSSPVKTAAKPKPAKDDSSSSSSSSDSSSEDEKPKTTSIKSTPVQKPVVTPKAPAGKRPRSDSSSSSSSSDDEPPSKLKAASAPVVKASPAANNTKSTPAPVPAAKPAPAKKAKPAKQATPVLPPPEPTPKREQNDVRNNKTQPSKGGDVVPEAPKNKVTTEFKTPCPQCGHMLGVNFNIC